MEIAFTNEWVKRRNFHRRYIRYGYQYVLCLWCCQCGRRSYRWYRADPRSGTRWLDVWKWRTELSATCRERCPTGHYMQLTNGKLMKWMAKKSDVVPFSSAWFGGAGPTDWNNPTFDRVGKNQQLVLMALKTKRFHGTPTDLVRWRSRWMPWQNLHKHWHERIRTLWNRSRYKESGYSQIEFCGSGRQMYGDHWHGGWRTAASPASCGIIVWLWWHSRLYKFEIYA